MEAEVIYYCEDHDDVDFVTLSECFGSPEEVANDFLSELGANTIHKASLIRRRVMYLIAILVASITILIAGVEIYIFYQQQQVLDVHYIESITYEENIEQYSTAPVYWSATSSNDNE